MTGQTLGHYRIVDRLGAGGMGAVYRAEDTTLRREVALKVLPAEWASSPERLERFEREAQTLAALDHPNIVHIYSVESEGGVPFLTMQLVRGQPLSALIPEGGLPLDRMLALAIPLADALRAAHEKGVIHRDLKPDNVMVDEEGRAKVLDFGLAKLRQPEVAEDASEQTTQAVTREGLVLGTVPYMSPEQAQGRAVDHRSDLFSFGIVLYEMLSGRRPFGGANTAAIVSALLRDDPVPLSQVRPGLPAPLVALVGQCLVKDPATRVQTAAEVRDALQAVQQAVASGQAMPAAESAQAASASPVRSRRLRLAGLTAAAVAAVLIGLWTWTAREAPAGGPSAPAVRALAVLPLKNLSGDPGQDYFVDGMTEALITDLSKIGALKVISRTSAMRYKETDMPLAAIADELGVDAVIEGSVIREGDRVGITAQLIEVATDRSLWAERYQRELTSILALQAEIARAIAQQIQVTLTPAERAQLTARRDVDPRAYEAYLKGQFYSAKITLADLQTALEYFELALQHDPEYAAAHAGISWIWSARRQMGFVPPAVATPLARSAAEKALAIDPVLAEAHHAYGIAVGWGEWDWATATSELGRAVELNPNYPEARAGFSHILLVQHRWDEALRQSAKALELDPFNPRVQGFHGVALLFSRRYDEAIALLEKVLETVPNSPPAHSGLWQAYRETGQPDRARQHAEAFFAVRGETEAAEALAKGWTEGTEALGMRRAAQLLAEQSQTGFVEPTFVARLWAYAGDGDRAMEWLEKAFAARAPNLPYVAVNPAYDFLRDDPRFEDLLRRLDLPDYEGAPRDDQGIAASEVEHVDLVTSSQHREPTTVRRQDPGRASGDAEHWNSATARRARVWRSIPSIARAS